MTNSTRGKKQEASDQDGKSKRKSAVILAPDEEENKGREEREKEREEVTPGIAWIRITEKAAEWYGEMRGLPVSHRLANESGQDPCITETKPACVKGVGKGVVGIHLYNGLLEVTIEIGTVLQVHSLALNLKAEAPLICTSEKRTYGGWHKSRNQAEKVAAHENTHGVEFQKRLSMWEFSKLGLNVSPLLRYWRTTALRCLVLPEIFVINPS
ncbi:unnamed protein product [Dovyalis caffra]|uniref:Uncharacterized protein n=1 Tax=Dovyalis caffra TaxID=77055 RepID=A0AAV1SEK8_9ROSI|nr:unnamed protein product [Dovyalis caffra]